MKSEIIKDSRKVEEMIISKALSGIRELPMLEVIFSGISTDLTSAMKSSLGLLIEVKGTKISYTNWSAITSEFDKFEICAVASAAPWKGPVVIAMDRGLFYSAFEMQMSGSAENIEAPDRYLSTIERRVAKRFTQVFLDQLSANFNKMTHVRFSAETIETAQHVSSIQGASSPCVMAETTVRIGTHVGTMKTLIPISTLDPAQQVLSTMFLGDNFEADVTWRDLLEKRVKGSSVEIQAVLERKQIDVAEILSWKPGSVISLDSDASSELSVTCSGMRILTCERGFKKDRVAIKILGEIGEESETSVAASGYEGAA